MFRIFVLIVACLSSFACSSPCQPSALPCDVLKEVVTLPDGTKYYHYVNARGEECSILTPAR